MSEKSFAFSAFPADAASLKSWPGYNIQDPYCTAAMAMVSLCRYAEDKQAGIDMLNSLKGPEVLSELDKQFIRDRFMDGKGYIPKSYFLGASPDNGYTPTAPYTIVVSDNPYSAVEANYMKLFVKSSGADSPREIVLRQKPSTGEWFLWTFGGVLSGIRVPKAADPWA